jgi:hypothetical protein
VFCDDAIVAKREPGAAKLGNSTTYLGYEAASSACKVVISQSIFLHDAINSS